MLAAQQPHHMKMAINVAEMDCKTAYMVFDFKQKRDWVREVTRTTGRKVYCCFELVCSELYATQYVTSAGKQMMRMYYSLGQEVPSVCVSIPSCHATSLIAPLGDVGINFTGVAVLLNSDSDETCLQIKKEKRRYSKQFRSTSQREKKRVEKQHQDEEALKTVGAVHPQCVDCLYHFKSPTLCVMIKESLRTPSA